MMFKILVGCFLVREAAAWFPGNGGYNSRRLEEEGEAQRHRELFHDPGCHLVSFCQCFESFEDFQNARVTYPILFYVNTFFDDKYLDEENHFDTKEECECRGCGHGNNCDQFCLEKGGDACCVTTSYASWDRCVGTSEDYYDQQPNVCDTGYIYDPEANEPCQVCSQYTYDPFAPSASPSASPSALPSASPTHIPITITCVDSVAPVLVGTEIPRIDLETTGATSVTQSPISSDTSDLIVVTATASNDYGMAESCSVVVPVYDPSAGFVTGGGWIESPAGAYAPDPSLEGKATFGFVSKYKKGQSVPDGNTQFVFHAGNMKFHSDSYEWLVVNQGGTNAQFKGSGSVNDLEGYHFMLWATDDTPADEFRIKIWYNDEASPVYDNMMNQPIGGGSIKIQDGNKRLRN